MLKIVPKSYFLQSFKSTVWKKSVKFPRKILPGNFFEDLLPTVSDSSTIAGLSKLHYVLVNVYYELFSVSN